jgi:phosphate transport system permease protein
MSDPENPVSHPDTRRTRVPESAPPPAVPVQPIAGAGDAAAAEGGLPIADLTPMQPLTAMPLEASAPASGAGLTDRRPVSGAGSVSGGGGKVRVGDRIFSAIAGGAGLIIILLVALVAIFLLAKALPSLRDDKVNFLFSRDWSVDSSTLKFGIVDLLWATVLASTVAMLIALPVAVGIALFITQYAPRRMARPVAFTIDLLAAIPSIIYGLWGAYVLGPKLGPVRDFLQNVLGWIPLFSSTPITSGTVFTGAIVLAVMILPIITAVAREVFERTPRANIEAALALGATRWEMIRLAVIPYGRPGVVSGAMLGLGRALGETIAVTLILSKMGDGAPFSFSVFSGGETFASKIANNSAEFNSPKQTGAYIAAGLVLFILTFGVNASARFVVNRKKMS